MSVSLTEKVESLAVFSKVIEFRCLDNNVDRLPINHYIFTSPEVSAIWTEVCVCAVCAGVMRCEAGQDSCHVTW